MSRDIDPDTPEYAKQFVTSWVKRVEPGRRKQFANAYIAYIEGVGDKPNYYEYGLTENQWTTIWRKLSAYSHQMGKSKASVGVIPS